MDYTNINFRLFLKLIFLVEKIRFLKKLDSKLDSKHWRTEIREGVKLKNPVFTGLLRVARPGVEPGTSGL